ncbi:MULTISPECIES: CidA/LrgA family protein [Clostridium]|uniref:CidA/LrgA family protein n=1 Tax=Clostridium TaxID=1485 RepID=UPI00069F38CB|nr:MULTISPECIES: CidA/LrgA family protein [Clostridium]KOF57435.1 hypothetical protein AGR56_13640 [Clostridium sp. DMHC 10]MCD2348382.1 CidA/LrgA family protein [Clostridium guangxiense]
MKLLRQLCIILGICFIGEALNKLLNLPIPGNVLGMIILLILLNTGIIKLEKIEEISNFLLEHLAFFFVPAGVGLISCFGLLKKNLISITFIILISTIIIMAVTGLTVQLLKRR